jgi:hypothetical protein
MAYHNARTLVHRTVPLVCRELDKQLTVMNGSCTSSHQFLYFITIFYRKYVWINNRLQY